MKFSLVVATIGRDREIAELIDSLLTQGRSDFVQPPALLKFDLGRVTGKIESAVLTLTSFAQGARRRRPPPPCPRPVWRLRPR